MIAIFLWNDPPQKGIPWKSKSVLHLPKGMGGLGIQGIEVFNLAIMMRKVSKISQ